MAHDEAGMSLEQFIEHLSTLGYRVDNEAAGEIWRALTGVQAMQARIRRRFDYEDEPAHVFRAGGEQ